MKRICLPLCCLFIFSIGVLSQQADNIKKLPSLNIPRLQKIDVKHITIDLRFNWGKKQANGTTSIKLSPLNATGIIKLDAGMLSINNVELQNGRMLQFNYDGSDRDDGLEILLDRTYQVNETITIKIDYHTNWVNNTDPNNIWGSNGKGIRFFEPSATEPKRRKQIWSMGEPESNRYWFPSYDSPKDLRTTDIKLTVEAPLTAISNGVLADTNKNADGTTTFHYKMDSPYPNYQTSFVIGEYINVKQAYRNIQLHSYGYPDELEGVKASVIQLPDIVKFYSDYTGIQYPFSNYSQVFVQEIANWIGNITTSTISENMIDDYGTHADFLYLWDVVEGEALAHQWFGSYVTIENWSDIWLNKAFPRYFSELYDEYKNGRDEFLLYQRSTVDYNTYIGDWNAGIRQPVVSKNNEDIIAFTSGNSPYFRGAMVLRMLHKHLGNDKWKKAIRYYLKSNANKSVTTDDFRKAIEEATGETMGWFFDQWVYKIGHPVFEIEKKFDEVKKQLVLIVKQTQKTDSNEVYPQVKFFQGKIDVEIDSRIETVWLDAKAENIFTFSVREKPKLVNFDYESAWIKEIRFEKTLDELLYQFQNDKDILGRSWAMSQIVSYAKNKNTSADDKIKIYAAFRNVILSNSYWRLRGNAAGQLQNLLVAASEGKPLQLDEATTSMLLTVIKKEKSWLRRTAILFLGLTKDQKYSDVYLKYLYDSSDRVVNAAAIALGMSKSPKAYSALMKLKNKPSWKNQSLISTLNGLKELGDPRGADLALAALADNKSPHWTLAFSVWDHRLAASETLVALGKADKGYPIIFQQFKKAVEENNLNDIFYNVQQVATLGDIRGQEVFDLLRQKYKEDANTMIAVDQYEAQFKDALKK